MKTDDLHTRIDNLEMLFSEQEYTVESLNTVVTRQAQEIEQLNIKIHALKHQLVEHRKQMPDNAIVDEKPPHY